MSYNLARFDLVSIRLAMACAQTGSLTVAARGSHLALGAASRRIRELEDALGDTLLLVLPAGHRLAALTTPLAFADALDEEWISLTAGAAMLQQQQQSALAAHRPFKLRMQVRSFDAVCHMVASGLGIAILPKAACLPIVKAMKISWRPLADPWAQRRLLVACVLGQLDAGILPLVDFLVEPSQNANARTAKQQ